MLLNLQKPMVIHLSNKAKYAVAANDPVEMDPAGIAVKHLEAGITRFYSWAAVTFIEQEH